MPLSGTASDGPASPAADARMTALRFLRAAREQAEIAEQLRALDPHAGLEPVAAVAAAAGYEVTIDGLRRAYADDWALRQVGYTLAAQRAAATADNAPSAVAVVNTASSST
jgi:hypothetical protein